MAQETIVVQQIGTNVSISTGGGANAGNAQSLLISPETMFKEVEAAARQAMEQMMSSGFPGGGGSRNNLILQSTRSHTQPALLTTRALDEQTRAQWQEDLRVMDKLLRDEVNRVEGDSRQAMGIRLLLVDRAHAAPMWVDGFGVIFDYDINLPLAGATGRSSTSTNESKTGSAWERARQSIESGTTTNRPARPKRPTGRTFEPATVEALVDALAAMLGEAKNMRHLKSDESVLVTVSGSDETGTPARLTLKASRRDIDRLASGKLSPADFRQALAWSIK
jgi:hypothetical protein